MAAPQRPGPDPAPRPRAHAASLTPARPGSPPSPRRPRDGRSRGSRSTSGSGSGTTEGSARPASAAPPPSCRAAPPPRASPPRRRRPSLGARRPPARPARSPGRGGGAELQAPRPEGRCERGHAPGLCGPAPCLPARPLLPAGTRGAWEDGARGHAPRPRGSAPRLRRSAPLGLEAPREDGARGHAPRLRPLRFEAPPFDSGAPPPRPGGPPRGHAALGRTEREATPLDPEAPPLCFEAPPLGFGAPPPQSGGPPPRGRAAPGRASRVAPLGERTAKPRPLGSVAPLSRLCSPAPSPSWLLSAPELRPLACLAPPPGALAPPLGRSAPGLRPLVLVAPPLRRRSPAPKPGPGERLLPAVGGSALRLEAREGMGGWGGRCPTGWGWVSKDREIQDPGLGFPDTLFLPWPLLSVSSALKARLGPGESPWPGKAGVLAVQEGLESGRAKQGCWLLKEHHSTRRRQTIYLGCFGASWRLSAWDGGKWTKGNSPTRSSKLNFR
ncbi:basic proline-rich protein-like [Suncus etruscus]|uniref:basic proline-rich protein-like n=1 Tax=Suncus etruscus TaxID=109475 RepID=UPI00211093AE|nr:basic proline-rich protein-like [Suncus etruscus]